MGDALGFLIAEVRREDDLHEFRPELLQRLRPVRRRLSSRSCVAIAASINFGSETVWLASRTSLASLGERTANSSAPPTPAATPSGQVNCSEQAPVMDSSSLSSATVCAASTHVSLSS